MKIENHTVVLLEDRDLKLAMNNGGLQVELPANSTKVIIRLMPKSDETIASGG